MFLRLAAKIMNSADLHADIRERKEWLRQRQSVLGERGMEVGLRTEKSDLDFKEREEEKLIKYVVQVLQVATVPSYM